MGGGLLQLVTHGEMEDKYLIGNPQISFFKHLYKKHTNFAIETKRLYFQGDLDFGRKTTININKLGDMISSIYLELSLPKLVANAGQTVSYVNSVGLAIIDTIELEIGGEIIVKHTGEWLNIWNQLKINNEKKKAYNNMIGKFGFIDSNTDPNGGIYIVPLNFWFCDDHSMAFPLVALQFHDIKLHIKLRPFNELYLTSDGNSISGDYHVGVKSNLYVDYIFLDRCERSLLAKNPHDILIKQLQIQEYSIPPNQTHVKIPLDFYHPIVELLWVIQRDDIKTIGAELGNDWFNYSDSLTLPQDEPLVSAKLMFNGVERIEDLSAKYYRLLESFKRHTSIPDDYIYMYSFSLKPELIQPTGSCNFSNVENGELILTLVDNLPLTNVRIFGINHNILTLSSGMAGLRFTN